MSVRTTISLPDDTKARMDALNVPVNWSAEATKCFEKLMGEIAARKQDKDLSDVIARLRASKLKGEDKIFQKGHDTGVYWATHHADYHELERAVNYDREQLHGEPLAPLCTCDWLAINLLGVDIEETQHPDGYSDDFWQAAGIPGGASAVDDMGVSFLFGFLEGAEEIWNKVADKL